MGVRAEWRFASVVVGLTSGWHLPSHCPHCFATALHLGGRSSGSADYDRWPPELYLFRFAGFAGDSIFSP
jgi:hypothetical protein